MTRKDYVLIADAICNSRRDPAAGIGPELERAAIIGAIASALKRDNPRFDPARFTAAADPRRDA